MDAKSERKVLIVGAGIGGLVLAQILRANNIPYQVFERDETWTGRNQGYSVGLFEALQPLQELLPKDLGELESFSVNYGSDKPDTTAMYDIEAQKVILRLGDDRKGGKAYGIRASRPKARDFFFQNLDVKVNKRFTHYTEDRDSITAHFEDGSTATGTILVGADGSRSRIRSQMLGEDGPQLQLSKWQVVFGEVDMPRLQYEEIQKVATGAIAGMYRDSMRFIWAVREPKPDGGAKTFWGLANKTDDPAAEVAWLNAASRKSKHRKVMEHADVLPPFMRELVELTGVDGLSDSDITLAEFVPPRALPRGRATLLGDSLHTMIPFRGAGANTACLDSCDLARILIKGWDSNETVDWMLKEYEDVALPRGREAVLSSRQAGEGGPEQMALLAARGRHAAQESKVAEAKYIGTAAGSDSGIEV